MFRGRLIAALILILALAPGAALAHPPVPTVALVRIETGGEVRVTIIHDGLAFALNDTSARISDADMLALLNGPPTDIAEALQDGRERMESGFRMESDGTEAARAMTRAPTPADVEAWKRENPGLGLPVKLEFEFAAVLPPGAEAVSFRFPAVLDAVMLVLDRPGVEPLGLPLQPGERSPPVDVRMATLGLSASAENIGHGSGSPPAPGGAGGVWDVARRYAVLGFHHVVPDGTDHAVFVFALFLLNPRFKSVLWQITAFTVAHTITLTLAALEMVSIPASIVEPAIALTIALVAVENLFVRRVHAWRPVVAMIFGLVHGLGFASALAEIGLPKGQLAAGLAAFSVGVEAGHLTVLLGAFALLGWCRGKAWYRPVVAVPLSLLIGVVAGWWAVERIAGCG